MGYLKHDLVLAHEPYDSAERLAFASDMEGLRAEMRSDKTSPLGLDFSALLVGPIAGVVNGYGWWALFPDGSKEGWAESDAGDKWRDRFKKIAARYQETRYLASWGEDGSFNIDRERPEDDPGADNEEGE